MNKHRSFWKDRVVTGKWRMAPAITISFHTKWLVRYVPRLCAATFTLSPFRDAASRDAAGDVRSIPVLVPKPGPAASRAANPDRKTDCRHVPVCRRSKFQGDLLERNQRTKLCTAARARSADVAGERHVRRRRALSGRLRNVVEQGQGRRSL